MEEEFSLEKKAAYDKAVKQREVLNEFNSNHFRFKDVITPLLSFGALLIVSFNPVEPIFDKFFFIIVLAGFVMNMIHAERRRTDRRVELLYKMFKQERK